MNGDPNKMRPVARVEDPKSGRVMTIDANQPGVQFYAGIFMDGGTKGKGRTHNQYSAFCLETQAFPNAINVPAWRDQVILKPGQDVHPQHGPQVHDAEVARRGTARTAVGNLAGGRFSCARADRPD